jgi:hypothetical protein
LPYNILTKCAVCGDRLEVSTLRCGKCSTKYEGSFKLDKFSYLTQEQKYFIEIFLKCRGNIKEVEKELNISYPTVRGKLDDVILSLGYEVSPPEKPQANKKEILDMLSRGEINYEEAVKMMRE